MGGTTLQVDVPLYIRYEVVDVAGQARIQKLYAHWEVLPMMSKQVFNAGLWPGISALCKLSANMLKRQGLGGALGFSQAFLGVGSAAKATTIAFLQALTSPDETLASQLLAQPQQLIMGTDTISISQLRQSFQQLAWSKMIAGGRYVSATLMLDKERTVAVFEFGKNTALIESVTIYRNTA